MTDEENQDALDSPNFVKLAIATIGGVLIIGGAVYGAYRYSQKQSNNIVLPGGVTYLGPTPKTENPGGDKQPPTAPLRFTAPPNDTWKTQGGKLYAYSFSYPSTLPLVVFPNDPIDSIAISWGNIPPQQNILLNIEFIDKRDPSAVYKPKYEFVKNWYKFFSGLKGVANVVPFTNTQGLKGYKATYINWADQTPNIDVFFEVPKEKYVLIHLANGILDPAIFDRILDTVKWNLPQTK